MSGTPDRSAPGMGAARRAAFEAEIGRLQLKSGKTATEQRLILLGVLSMIGGVGVAFVAFVVSTGLSDTRDVISMGILATSGLALAVAGGVVFLRYSVGRFLRFWLLRLIYEQRVDD